MLGLDFKVLADFAATDVVLNRKQRATPAVPRIFDGDELGRLLAREEGKILAEGIGEVVRAGQIFAFFAGEALRIAGEKLASVRPSIDVEITRSRSVSSA